MNKTFTFILFSALFLVSSFKLEEDQVKDKGSFAATVDGRGFQLREDQLLKGVLISKSGSMDGRTPARTVISATIKGKSYDKSDGKPFNESVQIETSYEIDKIGNPELFSVALAYQSTEYSMVKEQSHFKITQFTWEDEHKHFRLSADFDCKMRSWGYPADGKKDINLKGKMSNVRITVPSWINK